MPYDKLSDAPANIRELDGVALTLAQVNWIASVAEAIDPETVDSVWAVAIARFKESFVRRDGKWVKRKSMEPEESDKTWPDRLVNLDDAGETESSRREVIDKAARDELKALALLADVWELFEEHLKGQYIPVYASVKGNSVQLTTAVDDPTSYAKPDDLEGVLVELREKGQEFLLWNVFGDLPQIYRLSEDSPVAKRVTLESEIFRIDEMEQKVWGVVLVPESLDVQGDVVSAEEIESGMHDFMDKGGKIGVMHVGGSVKAHVIETYITTETIEKGDEVIPRGSWILGVKIENSAVWQRVLDGELIGFSVLGWAYHVPEE